MARQPVYPIHNEWSWHRARFWWAGLVSVIMLCLFFWAGQAFGAAPAQSMKAAITDIEKKLVVDAATLKENHQVSDKELADLVNELSALRASSLEHIRALNDERDAAKAALEQAQPEDADKPVAADKVAAAKLRSLQKEVAALDGLLVRANLNASQADQLVQQVSSLRKSLYFSTVFSRSSPPFSAAVWHQIGMLGKTVRTAVVQWANGRLKEAPADRRVGLASAVLFSFFLLLVLASPFYGWLERRFLLPLFGAASASSSVDTKVRLTIAFVRALVRVSSFVIAALLVFALLRLGGVAKAADATFLYQTLLVLCGVIAADAIARSVLSPGQAGLRLAGLSDRQAARYHLFAMTALWVLAFDHILRLGYGHGGIRLTLEALQAQSAGVTLVVGVFVLLAVLQIPLRFSGVLSGQASVRTFRFAAPHVVLSGVHLSAILVAITGLVSTLIGYVEFGRTLIWTLMLTVLVLAGYVLIRHVLKNLFALLWDWLWAGPSGAEPPSAAGGIIMNIWLRLFADIALVLGGLWVFLNLASFRISDLNLWINRFFEGIPLGATTIRPTAIAWAVAAFFLVILLFRGLRIYLRQGMKGQGEINAGANASILALVGYVGFVIALLVGFSALGLPFSNIALIASGLSLGIGFGLKDIANNFISGLILLFERPIKKGDWVVSSAGQGLVKNIGLRSTEIITFDRASIMVPNSELVSAPLTNWTHKDKTGRTKLQVGVAYGTDPALVREILLECATAHESVLRKPPAAVYWTDFGDSSLDFELRAFTNIRSLNDMIRLESDLRFAIYKAFAEHGIKIPFPQRDVHLIPAKEAGAVKAVRKKPRRKPKTPS